MIYKSEKSVVIAE